VTSRHFLTLLDCTPEELTHLVDRGIELKRLRESGTIYEPLKNRTLAMVFSMSSTRTRVAFEAGMQQLGGHAIFLAPDDTQLGRGEPIEDTARVLSEMVDVVMIRTLEQGDAETFANASSVPVINAMTSDYHPCQLLADVQTFVECRGPIQGKKVAFVGDGYNMCNSYINASRQFGFDLQIACPEGYEPRQDLLNATNSARLARCPEEAVADADLVVTDVWSSMGQEGEYQITPTLLDEAKSDVLFMHCLPAHRGDEVSSELMDDPRSVVWQEAGNRLHSQKALLEFLVR
jgi:ornithine carbamoyltransferase